MKATHYLHGTRVEAGSRSLNPLTSPVDGAPLGSVTVADAAVVDQVVQSAQKAFQSWSLVPVKDRVQVLYKFKTLVEKHIGELAKQVTAENGKTTAESAAGIARGIEIVEYAASLPQLFAGEILEVSTGVDCYTRRFPIGVVAGITPFNFPAMVPMWMFPMAIACGNSFILKPSEQVPFTPLLLADLLKESARPWKPCSIIPASPLPPLSAPRRSQRPSMNAALHQTSACSRSAEPRITSSSCRMPIRSSRQKTSSPAPSVALVSDAWRRVF
jgi:acyl-CoA reductase-like NAD-dependent aldehyde dehydrogenase